MILLDKEPRANIVATRPLPEGLSPSIIQPQIPDVFNKAFSKEPIGFLDPIINTPILRGRNRFISTLTPDNSKKDLFLRLLYRRSGRGPCPGCMANSEEGHHGGSKCTKRGISTFVSRIRMGNHVTQIPQNVARGGMRLRRTGVIV